MGKFPGGDAEIVAKCLAEGVHRCVVQHFCDLGDGQLVFLEQKLGSVPPWPAFHSHTLATGLLMWMSARSEGCWTGEGKTCGDNKFLHSICLPRTQCAQCG